MKILFMSALFTALGIQWFFMETVSLNKPTSLTMLAYCQVKIVTVIFPEYDRVVFTVGQRSLIKEQERTNCSAVAHKEF